MEQGDLEQRHKGDIINTNELKSLKETRVLRVPTKLIRSQKKTVFIRKITSQSIEPIRKTNKND